MKFKKLFFVQIEHFGKMAANSSSIKGEFQHPCHILKSSWSFMRVKPFLHNTNKSTLYKLYTCYYKKTGHRQATEIMCFIVCRMEFYQTSHRMRMAALRQL